MRALFRYIAGVFLIPLLFSKVYAQSFTSEAELKKKARELFKNEAFVEAAPYFSQLLSLYPKEPEYNFKYGACLIYSDIDKEKPIKYLEFSSKKEGVDLEVFYYLGKAYHLNYRFGDAINAYTRFLEKANPKQKQKYQPEREIEMCNNGKKLIRNITQLIVLEKKEVGEEDFFRSYNLGDFGGRIIAKPDEFKTPLDLKLKEYSIMFFPNNGKELYYSSYGESGKNGKDIFRIKRLNNGEWSKPESLGPTINTAYDEDFPFMHPNGTTLYFCSKGHNSMGGYDIFKSELNPATGKWGTPENLDFAISSPADDILFITDAEQKFAYFSSARASNDKRVTIYKVDIENKPEELLLVSGKLLKENGINPSGSSLKVYSQDMLIGAAFPDPSSGSFYLKLPNGGKFKYVLESGNLKIQPLEIEIAMLDKPRPLKQEVEIVKDFNTYKLQIKTIVAQELSDEELQDAIAVIKQQANLDVNYNESLINRFKERDRAVETDAAIVDRFNQLEKRTLEEQNRDVASKPSEKAGSSASGITNKDIISMAFEEAKGLKSESENLKYKSEFAYALAGQKATLSSEKFKESEQIKTSAKAMNDPLSQRAAMQEAQKLLRESEELAIEAGAIYKVAELTEKESIKKQKQAEQANNYAKELELAVNSKNPKEAVEKLQAQKEKLQSELSQPAFPEDAIAEAKKFQDENEKKAQKARSLEKDYIEEAEALSIEIANLEKESQKIKDKAKKDALLAEIKAKAQEKVVLGRKADEYNLQARQLENEARQYALEADFAGNLTAEYQSGDKLSALGEKDKQQVKEKIKDIKNLQASERRDEGIAGIPAKMEVSGSPQAGKKSGDEEILVKKMPENEGEAGLQIIEPINGRGEIEDYNSAYQIQLEVVKSRIDETERLQAEAQVLENWSVSLNKEAAFRKKKLENLKGKEKKSEEARIDKLTAQAIEKKIESDRKKSAVTPIAGKDADGGIATESSPGSAVNNNSGESPYTGIKAGKDGAKVNTASSAGESREGIAENTVNKDATGNNAGTPNAIEGLANSTNTASAKDLSTKEDNDNAKKNNPAGSISPDKTNADTSIENSESRTVAPSGIEGNKALISGTEMAANIPAFYVNPLAKAVFAKGYEKEIEAGQLEKESKKTSENLVNAKTVEERNTLLDQSTGLDTKARETRVEAKKAFIEANEIQIQNNQIGINKKISDVGDKDVDDNTSIGLMLAEEAVIYFQKSKESLKAAEAAPNFLVKQNSVEKAEEFSNLAMEKQLKALELLKLTPGRASDNSASASKAGARQDNEQNSSPNARELAINQKPAGDNNSNGSAGLATQGGRAEVTTGNSAGQKSTQGNATQQSMVVNPLNNPPEKDAERQPNTQAPDEKAKIETLRLQATIEQNNAETLLEAAKLEETEAGEIRVKASGATKKREKKKSEALAVTKEKSAVEKRAEAKKLLAKSNQLKQEADLIETSGKGSEGLALNNKAQVENKIGDNKTEKEIPGQTDPKPQEEEIPKSEKVKIGGLTGSSKADNSSEEGSTVEKKSVEGLTGSSKAANQQPQEDVVDVNSKASLEGFSGKAVSAETADKVGKSKEAAGIRDVRKEAAERREQSKAEEKKAQALKQEGQRLWEQSLVVSDKAGKAKKKERPALIRESEAMQELAKMKFAQSDSINLLAKNYEAEAQSMEKEEGQLLQSVDNFVYNENQENRNGRAVNTQPENKKAEQAESNSLSTLVDTEPVQPKPIVAPEKKAEPVKKYEIPKVLQQELFDQTPAEVYSTANPIPVDIKLPEGLVFKVQVGAFRNPIPQDLFKGFAPITGETTPQGFTRYTAGFFRSFETANLAKDVIRGYGYSDAFVVAFYNGQRISVGEAQAMLRQGGANQGQQLAQSSTNSRQPNSSSVGQNTPQQASSTNAVKPQQQPANPQLPTIPQQEGQQPGQTPQAISSPAAMAANMDDVPLQAPANGAAPYKELNNLPGLLYTVQVGVYTRPVPPSQLYNIQPLFVETTGNGMLRYTSGVYDDVNKAVDAKNTIAGIGIRDAFVTAYYNGKRITVAEARAIEANNKAVLVKGGTVNSSPKVVESQLPAQPQVQQPAQAAQLPQTLQPTQASQVQQVANSQPAAQTTSDSPGEVDYTRQGMKTYSLSGGANNAGESVMAQTVVVTNLNKDASPVPVDFAPYKEVVKEGLEFKIQLGAFKDEVPLEIASQFLLVASYGINHYINSQGLTIYSVGSYSDYASAHKMRVLFADEKGFKDAFVAPYYKGNKVSINEALEILKK
jgi:epidermal growth factor receptor substrate 15